jgi:Asp-tRNA(Asn)/Glu-tRNA(Gln) amidotransferase A subunit family amidase
MTIDLAFLTIAEASALIQARRLSPVEYVEALIARTESFDPQVHASITRRLIWRANRPSRPSTRSWPVRTADRCTASPSR